MSRHQLGGGTSVELLSLGRVFRDAPVTLSSDKTLLAFGDRDPASPMARVSFRFRPSGTTDAHRFGIQQLCFHESRTSLYAGIKSLDGSIEEGTTSLNRNLFLDIAATSLTVLFEPGSGVSTGARATAAHAPFFSAAPVPVRAGAVAELGIVDSPGGNHPTERRNAATDRLNYLIFCGASAQFLTVLTAVVPAPGKALHVPLVGVRWRWDAEARAAGESQGAARIVHASHRATHLGSTTDFTPAELALLANTSLTAADCISQKFNNAMFRSVGLHQRQDFGKRPLTRLEVGSGGYTIDQFPDFSFDVSRQLAAP